MYCLLVIWTTMNIGYCMEIEVMRLLTVNLKSFREGFLDVLLNKSSESFWHVC